MGTVGIQPDKFLNPYGVQPRALPPAIARQLPTRRQRAVFDFIIKYRAMHGRTPTLDEIGDQLAIAKRTAKGHVDCLIARGLLYREKHCSRLAIVPRARADDDNAAIAAALKWAAERPDAPAHVADAYRRWIRTTPA